MRIIKEDEFQNEINKPITLVDFFANWCGPCKMLAPILEELAAEHPEINFVKVDTDESESIAMQYGIMSIPTLFLFKNGELKGKTSGYMQKRQLEKFIEDSLNK